MNTHCPSRRRSGAVSSSHLEPICRRLPRVARARRLALGRTLQQVADRGGLSLQAVDFVERGLRVPRFDTLARLSRGLDWSALELVRAAHRCRARC